MLYIFFLSVFVSRAIPPLRDVYICVQRLIFHAVFTLRHVSTSQRFMNVCLLCSVFSFPFTFHIKQFSLSSMKLCLLMLLYLFSHHVGLSLETCE